ncbi:hypothetical protein MHW47_14905 [Streptomyces sp. OfavH-34-F]|uniref:hypothetical protein n=1 Tax=Streptomyces sp. OfavH-34-F TaxID=2917760 RepID=UPI001EF2505C|nr:hypothetical protein [Streptomyces sp. OfavH-34-F]MCG7525728.1 hypothetical protein [Streptomyces sp. OfavH-34-F]
MGVVFGDALRVLFRSLGQVLAALLLAELAIFLLTIATLAGMYALRGGPDATGMEPDFFLDMVLVVLLPFVVAVYGTQGAVAALAAALAQLNGTGARVTVRGLVGASVRRIPGATGGYLLSFFLLPLMLTPLAPVAVRFWVLYALAPSVMGHEGVGMLRALGRAQQLTRGAWWRTFRPLALAALLVIGMDLMLGFVPFPSLLDSGYGNGSGDLAGRLGLVGLTVGLVAGFVAVLTVQVAFIHLVGDRLYQALREREAALARPYV